MLWFRQNLSYLTNFNTCGTLIYYGGCLENIQINGCLHPNISLYHEIEANMKKIIINLSTFSLCNSHVIMLRLLKMIMKD
jgi:hypothetical protein